MLFVNYPKCTTCQKAKKWLDEHQLSYTDRNIKEHNPTAEELEKWIYASGKDVKSFFNTSGLLYKSLNLKAVMPDMSDSDKIKLLATDGMLVKRPIVVSGDIVLVGFKPEEWRALL